MLTEQGRMKLISAYKILYVWGRERKSLRKYVFPKRELPKL